VNKHIVIKVAGLTYLPNSVRVMVTGVYHHCQKLFSSIMSTRLIVVWFGWFMVFNATFNNMSVISWWSVSFVVETRVSGENHRPVTSHWKLHHI